MNFNDKVRAMALRLIGNNNSIISAAAEATEPKEYVALLTQSGTDAPVIVVLKNTLGGTVVWTRSSGGVFVGTLAGAFPAGKCDIGDGDDDSGVFIYYLTADGTPIYLNRGNANTIIVRQYTDLTLTTTTDNIAVATPVKIKVYP